MSVPSGGDERMPPAGDAPKPIGREAEPVRPDADAPDPDAAAPGAPVPDAPVPEAPAPGDPIIEEPSPDVVGGETSTLPGVHRGGYLRLPTAPIQVTRETAPAEFGADDFPSDMTWEPTVPPPATPHRGLAVWALVFAIAGLVASFFVGWGFPIGLVAIVSASLALRRPFESRAVAIWALALGTISLLYSAGWLMFAALRSDLFT